MLLFNCCHGYCEINCKPMVFSSDKKTSLFTTLLLMSNVISSVMPVRINPVGLLKQQTYLKMWLLLHWPYCFSSIVGFIDLGKLYKREFIPWLLQFSFCIEGAVDLTNNVFPECTDFWEVVKILFLVSLSSSGGCGGGKGLGTFTILIWI